MNVIQYSLDTVKFKVPRPILEKVFITPTRNDFRNYGNQNQNRLFSLDKAILMKVIYPRVLVNCNLVGGVEAFIDLDSQGVERERINDYTSVFYIPKSLTDGRSIMSVLNITFSDPSRLSNFGAGITTGASVMARAGQAVVDAMGSVPVTSSAHAQLIGENIVSIRDNAYLPQNMFLRAILANDDNLTHIQPKSYIHFAKLVEYAVKSFIYNEYIVQMDMGELMAGQNLGVFKEIITGYADSEELYETYLREKWAKVALMNDRESYHRFLKSIVGGNR